MLTQDGMFLDEKNRLYEKLVPEDHELRVLSALVDFTFIYSAVKDTYCHDNGRRAVSPIVLFKYLVLKSLYQLSDVDVVKHSLYNLSFKFFLGFDLEDTKLIDPSLLTKFRRTRLANVDFLDKVIEETMNVAFEHKVIKSKSIIVDSTHSTSRYNQKAPKEVIVGMLKDLRKESYRTNKKYVVSIKEGMPTKPNPSDDLETYMEYGKELIKYIQSEEKLSSNSTLQEQARYTEEIIEDNLEDLRLSTDPDAKVGHKSVDTSFFGFKNHLALSEERIITAATVTTGEKHDGKELEALINKSEANGMEIETVIGDGAYAERSNLEYGKEHRIDIVANVSSNVSHGMRNKNMEFEFNKDAEMYVCPAGHMAIRTARTGGKHQDNCAQTQTYYFDIEKCKNCPLRDGCYKDGAKSKTYSVSITKPIHKEQIAYMKTDEFQDKMKHRYKIEAKNAELKNNRGLRTNEHLGLLGMRIQLGAAIFVTNMKRIMVLKDQQERK